MDKIRKIIKNLLLAFVLVSIGYALGKHSVKRMEAKGDDPGKDKGLSAPASLVQVYYLHATLRCMTCNTIEKMTRELLNTRFAAEMTAGRITFSEVNFQENEKLAEQFDVVSSCVLVARVEKGEVTDFKRLDEVWTLLQDPKKFDDYISAAVLAYLPGGNENKRGDK